MSSKRTLAEAFFRENPHFLKQLKTNLKNRKLLNEVEVHFVTWLLKALLEGEKK